ncbi:MAG TPA: hypothetical protein VMD30_09055, partial [Tepidisphaeraceae bacterium]|nr:hypothetical protein [Tepidisphaeraceae bacterium]
MRWLVVTAMMAMAAPLVVADQDQQAAIPVKVVVLYSSGVGYFQHEGTINGNATAQLQFRSDQINDVLKSLVLQDMGGGTVSAVNYPSENPLDKTLKSFDVDITDDPSLAELLTQLRGVKVSAVVQGQTVSGTVLGVEKRPVAADDKSVVQQSFLTLLAGAEIHVVPLSDVRDLQLDDPKLQAELAKALAALAASRDQDKKPVTIDFSGQGKREVRVGYIAEAPVWKTSYRLLLKDEPTTQPSQSETATLQGW